MLRFWISTLLTALLLPPLIDWGRRESEAQIDKMQAAAFNTPGAETPLPLSVIAGGLLLAAVHLAAGLWLLRLRLWQAAASLVAAVGLGGAAYLAWRTSQTGH